MEAESRTEVNAAPAKAAETAAAMQVMEAGEKDSEVDVVASLVGTE